MNNLSSFFWRYISFFWYFHFIISFIILWRFPWKTCYSISNFITNSITSFFCSFLNDSFWSSFYYIRCRFLRTIKRFLALLIAHVFSKFSGMCTRIFNKWQKSIDFYICFVSRFNWISHFYNGYIMQLLKLNLFYLLLEWLTVLICKPYFNFLTFWIKCF